MRRAGRSVGFTPAECDVEMGTCVGRRDDTAEPAVERDAEAYLDLLRAPDQFAETVHHLRGGGGGARC